MQRLGRWLFGFRDDLQLDQRWWHRLLKVLSTLIIFGALVGYAISDFWDIQQPPVADVHTISLRAYTKAADPTVVNTISGFLSIPGELGGIKEGKVTLISDYVLTSGQSICSVKIDDRTAIIAEIILKDDGKPYTPADLADLTKDVAQEFEKERRELKRGEDRRYCWLSNTDFDSASIVKYRYTFRGRTKSVIADALDAVVVLLPWGCPSGC